VLGATLSLTDTVVAWLNVTMVTASIIVNWYAFYKAIPGLRMVHAAIAVLSTFYVLGYIWLLSFVHDVATWSSVMRGLSILAWSIVWIAPALQSIKIWRSMRTAVLREVSEACER